MATARVQRGPSKAARCANTGISQVPPTYFFCGSNSLSPFLNTA